MQLSGLARRTFWMCGYQVFCGSMFATMRSPAMPLHISKLDCKFVRVRVRVLLLLLLLRKWRKSTNESLRRRSRCFKAECSRSGRKVTRWCWQLRPGLRMRKKNVKKSRLKLRTSWWKCRRSWSLKPFNEKTCQITFRKLTSEQLVLSSMRRFVYRVSATKLKSQQGKHSKICKATADVPGHCKSKLVGSKKLSLE